MKEKTAWISALVSGIVLYAAVMGGGTRAGAAGVRINSFEELRAALEKSGKETVELRKNITVTSAIHVRGVKTINGNGCSVRRLRAKKKTYGGSMFVVEKGTFSLRNVIITGNGEKAAVRDVTYGRLIEVWGGRLFLESGAVLKNNRNDSLAVDGGGAVLVAKGARCVMRGGRIGGNVTVSGGAGVRVERGGVFVMKGGDIVNNRAFGIGRIEGFDGRGGAIYNAGRVTISGGRISGNRAKKYSGQSADYGGVGGMLYNKGICRIAGGTARNNTASMGGAVYIDERSELTIAGGMIRGNRASEEGDVFFGGGTFWLRGRPDIGSVYVRKNRVIETKAGFAARRKIMLIPESYRNGLCVARTKKKSAFTLKKKNGYELADKQGKLCVEKAEYRITFYPNGGQGQKKSLFFSPGKQIVLPKNSFKREGYDFIGWGEKKESGRDEVRYKDGARIGSVPDRNMRLYAVWVKSVHLVSQYKKLRFYVGEHVDERVLTCGVKLREDSGERKAKIKIARITAGGKVYKNPRSLNTSGQAEGTIFYDIAGGGDTKALGVPYTVKANKKPEIRTAKRYLFVREVRNYTAEQWKKTLYEGCRLRDDRDSPERLWKNARFDWGGLLANKQGSYHVKVKIRDQIGRRFGGADKGTRLRGRGKEVCAVFSVTLVDRQSREGENRTGNDGTDESAWETGGGYVRFMPVSPLQKKPEEIWRFDREDVREAKRYMREQADPFSAECNQNFYRLFEHCRRVREEGRNDE